MAEENKKLERIYTVPLRRHWLNVPEYKRTRKAVLALKQFIAKHMKVMDRNIDNVKLDMYLNNEMWFRGKANPPSKVKVKAVKEGDIVTVSFFETPKHINFIKIRHSKRHTKAKAAPVAEEKKDEKTAEEKKDEVEKEKAVEQQNIKQAESAVKAEKHTTKIKEPKINRMALKK